MKTLIITPKAEEPTPQPPEETPAEPTPEEKIDTEKRLDAIEECLDELTQRVGAIEAKCGEQEKAAKAEAQATAQAIASIRAALLPNAGRVTPAPEAHKAETFAEKARALAEAERAAFICANANALLAEAFANR